jgi:hypothetical protein
LSARFGRYALFENEGASGDVEVLATMDDGAPVFLAARRGKGRVVTFSSSVDKDWNDLCIRTAFLPLMQRLAAWLTGSLEEREELRAHVGGSVLLSPEAGVVPAVVKSPSGRELPVTRAPGATTVSAGPLPEPGRYEVLDEHGQGVAALAFAASLDPQATELSRHKGDEVSAWFGEDVVRTAGDALPGKRTPVWTWLIALAAVAFFFEGVLLRK